VYFTGAMANAYDLVLRERAVAAYERGDGSYADLAAVFALDHRTLERWVARLRATGSVAPHAKGGGWRCRIDLGELHAVIRERPDGTTTELCRAYNRRVRRAQRTTPTSFRRAMRRVGYMLKKTAAAERSRPTGRPGQARRAPEVGAPHRSESFGLSR
jgi:transposase